MKRSEKILLTLFAIAFALIVGGGGLSLAIKKYRAIGEDTERLSLKLSSMATDIAQGSKWQARSEYVQAHVPKFGTAEEASSKLFDLVSKEAEKLGLKTSAREMVPAHIPAEGEDLGFFDKASVKITFADAPEQALFTWMHALQKPDAFIGITRLLITPSAQGKTVACEVDITQFYRQTQAVRLSKAD